MGETDVLPGVVTWLMSRSHLMAPEELPGAADEAARRLGAVGGLLHLVSRDQRVLRPLLRGQNSEDGLSLDGTLPGRAFRMGEVVASASKGFRLWVPLLDGTERLGVFQVEVADESDRERLPRPAVALASVLAELTVSKGQYTDSYEKSRRALPMGVPAELLWRELPPTTFASSATTAS